MGPTTPATQRLPAVPRDRFSLFRVRSPLLTESLLFSLPVGTEMFHFPTFPPHALCVQARVTGHDSSRVSPFGHPRITVRLPTPRGLSQAPTSFIGSWCQGIHRVPLQTWPQSTKMLASTVQFSSYGRTPSPHPAPTCAPAQRFDRGDGPRRANEQRPFPQDPTACPGHQPRRRTRSPPHPPRGAAVLASTARTRRPTSRCSTHEHRTADTRHGHGPGHRHPTRAPTPAAP